MSANILMNNEEVSGQWSVVRGEKIRLLNSSRKLGYGRNSRPEKSRKLTQIFTNFSVSI